MAQYKEHLKQLEKERKVEEVKLHELLEEYRKAVEAKQEGNKCKEELAKEELHKTVLKERAEQIQYKKEEAERQLNQKQEENQALNNAIETNRKLDMEAQRQALLARDQYRDHLRKQIEYSNELRVSKIHTHIIDIMIMVNFLETRN